MTEMRRAQPDGTRLNLKSLTFYGVACIAYVALFNAALTLPSMLRAAIILPLVLIVPGWLALSLIAPTYKSRLHKASYAFGVSLIALISISVTLDAVSLLLPARLPLSLMVILAEEALPIILLCILFFTHSDPSPPMHIIHTAPSPRTLLHLSMLFPLPLLAVVGSVQLDNGGSRIPATLVPAYVLAVFTYMLYVRRSLPSWFYPAAILFSAASLVLQYSLRSSYLFGSDVHQEFMVFSLALQKGYWSPSASESAYNSCLSVTVLPLTLKYLTHLDGYTLFKVILPVITSFTAVIVYAIAKMHISTKKALLATLFFIGYPSFTSNLIMHLRTGIALLFFALFVLAYFDSRLTRHQKTALLLLSGIGVIVSHYSTAYLFLGTLIVWKIVGGYLLNRRLGVRGRTLSWKVLLCLISATLVWQIGINNVSAGMKEFVFYSMDNYKLLVSRGPNSALDNVTSQFALRNTYGVSPQKALDQSLKSAIASGLLPKGVALTALPMPSIGYAIGALPGQWLYLAFDLDCKLLKLLVVVAPLFYLCRMLIRKRTGHLSSDLVSLGVSCIIVLMAVVLVPGASLAYTPIRTFQMVIIVVGILVVVGVVWLQRLLRLPRFVIAVPFLLYFIVYSGLLVSMIGGGPAFASLGNGGPDYQLYYESKPEYAMIRWLSREYSGSRIVSDQSMYEKLLDFSAFTNLDSNMIVYPLGRSDTSCVVAGTMNQAGAGYAWFNGEGVRYVFPDLSVTKDCVYSSGGAAVYK